MSKIFGKNLRTYRIMAGMTQSELAAHAGTTRSSVNNYECGASEPSFEVLCKFARALGVTYDDLINEHQQYQNFVERAQITDEERALIDVYRKADRVYQNVAMDLLREHPAKPAQFEKLSEGSKASVSIDDIPHI